MNEEDFDLEIKNTLNIRRFIQRKRKMMKKDGF
jgi:hypothetical protein